MTGCPRVLRSVGGALVLALLFGACAVGAVEQSRMYLPMAPHGAAVAGAATAPPSSSPTASAVATPVPTWQLGRAAACPVPWAVAAAPGYPLGQPVTFPVVAGPASPGSLSVVRLGPVGGVVEYQGELAGTTCVAVARGDPVSFLAPPGSLTGPTQHGLVSRGLVPAPGGLACPDDAAAVVKPVGGIPTAVRPSLCLLDLPAVVPDGVAGGAQLPLEGIAHFFVTGVSFPGNGGTYASGIFVALDGDAPSPTPAPTSTARPTGTSSPTPPSALDAPTPTGVPTT